MDTALLKPISDSEWRIEPHAKMRVPAVLFASEELIREMDTKVYEQIVNVASLPGIQKAAYAMPDAHWGYGFPIGGVAAFLPDEGGVVSAGGVGFDISCGVRTLLTGLKADDFPPIKEPLADALYRHVPVPAENEVSVKEELKTEQLGDLKIHFARSMEELAQMVLLPADESDGQTRSA